MGTMKKRIRSWVEQVTGREVVRFGPRSFSLVRPQDRGDFWFSYRSQLKLLLEKNQVDLVIDVGANEGQFASGLRGDYAGEILSFEPVRSAFRALTAKAASDSRWRALNTALGSQPSTQVMHVSNQTKFSSLHRGNSFSTERFGNDALSTTEEVVSIRTLEDVLNETHPNARDQRIFLKMDTQGHDLEVFKGAGARLQNVVVIQSELSVIPIYDGITHWTESIQTYEQAGFGVVGLFPICRDATARVIEYDCLLVRS